MAPRFRLFHFGAHEQREKRRQSTDEKQRPPAPMRIDNTIHAGGQQKSKRVALLQQARNKSAPADRNGFHSERCSHAPLTPHSDAVEQSQTEQHSVVRLDTAKTL